MICRCGHGHSWHRRAMRLSGWERARGRVGPRRGAWLPCQFTTFTFRCGCRNWHPEEVNNG